MQEHGNVQLIFPFTPQQNKVAKRMHRVFVKMVMLKNFWEQKLVVSLATALGRTHNKTS